MTLSHCIDWLQFSVPFPEDKDPIEVIAQSLPPSPLFTLTGEKGTNIQGYNTCLMLAAGKVHFHTEQRRNKISFQFTGTDLSYLAQNEYNVIDLLTWVEAQGFYLTRLDFAIDVKDEDTNPVDILGALNNGEAKTMAQRWGAYLGFAKQDGKVIPSGTVYVGSPTSQRMLRVYDKGAERDTGADWTRIELVSRKDASRTLGAAMVVTNIGDAGRTAMRWFISSGVAWFDNALNSQTVYIQPIASDAPKTLQWLMTVVLPIVDRWLRYGPESGVDGLYSALNAMLARYHHLYRGQGDEGEDSNQ